MQKESIYDFICSINGQKYTIHTVMFLKCFEIELKKIWQERQPLPRQIQEVCCFSLMAQLVMLSLCQSILGGHPPSFYPVVPWGGSSQLNHVFISCHLNIESLPVSDRCTAR